MKRIADQRYYLCPDKSCIGQVAPVLRDEQKRPVYLCFQCSKQFSQTEVDQAYRLRRMRDGGTP